MDKKQLFALFFISLAGNIVGNSMGALLPLFTRLNWGPVRMRSACICPAFLLGWRVASWWQAGSPTASIAVRFC